MKLNEAKTVADLNPRAKKILLTFVFLVVFFVSLVCIIPSDDANESGINEFNSYISGLDPWISNKALEKYGFSTSKDLSTNGCTWNAKRTDFGITYLTKIYSPKDADKASSFQLTIMVEPGVENISKGKWMMKELAGIKYDGSDAAKAYEWVENNYNNNSTIDIGGVRLSILAPSNFVRMLCINKINPETGQIYN